MNNILVIRREEHHYWPSCPCEICEAERSRQKPLQNPSIIHLSVDAACLLGFIKRQAVREVARTSGRN